MVRRLYRNMRLRINNMGFDKIRSSKIDYQTMNPIQYMIRHGKEYDEDDEKDNSINYLMNLLCLSAQTANIADVITNFDDFKTIFDEKTGALLGAHMIGPEVTELIQGYVVAQTLETTETELMQTIFPHPTLSEAMHEAVLDAYGKAIHF